MSDLAQESAPSSASSKVGFKNPVFWILVFLFVFLDLLTKNWAFSNLPAQSPEFVWGKWFGWQRLHNSGGVFGIGQNMTVPLTIIRVFAVGLLIWLAASQDRKCPRAKVTLALVLAGAMGNLYDNLGRWFGWSDGTGHVRDFIRIDLGAAVVADDVIEHRDFPGAGIYLYVGNVRLKGETGVYLDTLIFIW